MKCVDWKLNSLECNILISKCGRHQTHTHTYKYRVIETTCLHLKPSDTNKNMRQETNYKITPCVLLSLFLPLPLHPVVANVFAPWLPQAAVS